MRKVLFEVPWTGYSISSFSVALALACFAALRITAWRARREGLSVASVYDLAFWLISGGFIGARLLFLAVHPETIQSPLDVFKIWQGGIVFYGCLLGGLIGSCMYWGRHPFPFLAMCDAVAPALCLGTAIGRVGCYFNGCCFGARSSLPWAVQFPADTAPWALHVERTWIAVTANQSLPVHPTQLYSAFNGFLVLALLTYFYPRRRANGQVMALAMIAYPIARFLEEALRDDEAGLLFGLSLAQIISVSIFAVGLIFWRYLAKIQAAESSDHESAFATSSIYNGPHFFKASAEVAAPRSDRTNREG